MKTQLTYLLLAAIVLTGCKKDPAELDLGDVDASRYVAIGTDGTAGYADDALYYDGQVNSYANILAGQLTTADVIDFNQPLAPETSVGINLNGDAELQLGYKTDCKDTVSLSPVRKAIQGNTAQ